MESKTSFCISNVLFAAQNYCYLTQEAKCFEYCFSINSQSSFRSWRVTNLYFN